MRVLAVSSYAGLGGSELTFVTFLEHRPADAQVDVLLVSDGPLRERLEPLGLPVRVAEGGEGRPDLRMARSFHRQFREILARGHYDVIWALGQKAALLGASAARTRRVPMMWHKVDFSWDWLLARPLGSRPRG